jgi:23S rRNA (adenine2503-C2)-methyltransferase
VTILKKFVGKSGTIKYLFRLSDGNLIEGVYMPHDYGNTLCLSTQIGCRMGCSFCASGLDGLLRNLTPGEMLGQVIAVNRDNGGTTKDRAVTNLVLMGSGEPFDNYQNVLKFLDLVSMEKGIGISERNISLSTSGLADKIREFADSGHKVTLSISLHAPFDELRSSIMPVNKKYNINKIVSASKYYFEKTGRRVIFEYTLIKGTNDSPECAKELATLTRGFPSHVNLIRLNEVKERNHRAPTEDATKEFLKRLEALGVSATIRRSLGNDIEGACGQLRRRYLEEQSK